MEGARQMPQINFRAPKEVKIWAELRSSKERMSLTSWLVRLIEKDKETHENSCR